MLALSAAAIVFGVAAMAVYAATSSASPGATA
jgi:hypothetical protein